MPIATNQAKTPPHPLLTRSELALLCRVDPTTIDNWRRAGELDDLVVPLPKGRFRYRRSAAERRFGLISA